jgi:predicted phage terminase large subunit-like protein
MMANNDVGKLGGQITARAFENCRNSYPFYVWYTHNAPDAINGIVPERWVKAKALMWLTTQVQRFIEKPCKGAYDILIISMPPQHGKSQSVTETLPSWFLGKWPEKRAIIISYNDDTAKPFMRRNVNKIRTYGNSIFGIQIGSVDTAEEIELSNGRGSLISRGIGSGVTSRPADLIIVDDPVKNREDAESELKRNLNWNEWTDTITSRLSAGAKIILIMTRWHEDDLAGRVLEHEDPKLITKIRIPCEAEENDVLGRKRGEALCPEFGKGQEWLSSVKYKFLHSIDQNLGVGGMYSWNALYQGRPSSAEGNQIKRQWWKFYDKPPEWLDEQVQSWDCTFKETAGTDSVAGEVWGRHGADCYLLDLINDQMDINDTMRGITQFTQKWPKTLTKLVEDKANGPAVIQLMRRKVPGLIAVNPEGGKITRVNSILGAIEAGNVWLPLPEKAPWVNEFIEQCAQFPNGKHDDMVDAMSQALIRLLRASKTRDPANRKIEDDSFEARERRNIERLAKQAQHGKKPAYV